MNRNLVVLLCDGYPEAVDCFVIFMEWLERHESWTISRVYTSSNGVDTTDGYRYVFIDCRLVDLFLGMTDDIVYVQEFFDEIFTDENERRILWKN